MKSQIKRIGKNGQISLGKEFSGREVLLDSPEAGVWIIKAGSFIPDNEKWLHEPENAAKLNKALQWAAQNEPKESNLDELVKKLPEPLLP